MVAKNLEHLRNLMLTGDPSTIDSHGQWRSDLQNFGGPVPDSTYVTWSWDKERLLIGECADTLEIIDRDNG
jgi:hypothetical protein